MDAVDRIIVVVDLGWFVHAWLTLVAIIALFCNVGFALLGLCLDDVELELIRIPRGEFGFALSDLRRRGVLLRFRSLVKMFIGSKHSKRVFTEFGK